MLAGVVIGLVVGLVLALAVAFWVTGSNPFQSADAPTPAAPVAEPADEPAPPPAPEPATRPAPAAPPAPEPAPSFDFYKVLPGEPQAVLPKASEPPSQPLLYVQVGAFQNPTDADNLKASLALLGIEANIQSVEVPEKGILHRVRIGPLDGMEAVERTRELLTKNNLPAYLVKQNPASQEMP
jgi:cell division protein FtsN